MGVYDNFLSLKDGDIIYFGKSAEGEYVPDHLHGSLYEITVVTEGFGTMYTDGIPTAVKKGDVYLSFPFDHHKIESDSSCRMCFDFISFTVTNPEYASEFAKIWIDNISAQKRLRACSEIADIISAFLNERQNGIDEYKNEIYDILLSRLIITYISRFGSDIGKASNNANLCCEIISYIDANFYDIKHLRDIGTALGYHYNYLSGVFRNSTKLSLDKYYTTRKMEIARTLLAKEGTTVTKTAKILGYSDVQSFSKSFYKHFLKHPKDIKKRTSGN